MANDGLDKLSRNKRIGISERQPDPTKTSVIGAERDGGVRFDHVHTDDNSLPYLNKETRVFKDSSGRSYFEINKFGSDQMFLAKILKGIMPVSDVVYNNGKYLSYEMPLDTIPRDFGGINWKERMSVYSFILHVVFHDPDHYIINLDKNITENRAVSKGAVSIFDLDHFGRLFWSPYAYVRGVPTEARRNEYYIKNKICAQLYRETLSKLHNALAGEAGLEFLRAILHHIRQTSSQIPATITSAYGDNENTKIRSFRDEVLERMDSLERLLNEYNAK